MPKNKLSEKQITNLKILRANGMSYKDIAELTSLSLSTVHKYCKDVSVLPPNRRRNPLEPLSIEQSMKVVKARLPTAENRRIAEEIEDIEWFIDNHEEGTRFEGPLRKIPLKKLQEIMEVPTNYHSPLNIKEWVDYYLAGPENGFLKYAPHKWTKLQYEMFDAWSKHKKVMFETFRDAGKTMVANAILIHEICEHRDNNYAIASETQRKALKRVKQIGDVLLTNKKIIADYGFLPHITKYMGMTQTWTKDEITVKRDSVQTDPTLTCFSSQTAEATGAHFNGIVYDDIWSRNLQKNASENIRKWFDWYDGELEGCLEQDTWELFLLTRKGVNDLYRELEDRNIYVIFKRPAVVKFPSKYEYKLKEVKGNKLLEKVVVKSKDYEITDPERFTIEFFLEKMFKMPEPKWRAEYQLDPIAEKGQFFKWSNLRFINSYSDFTNLVEQKKWGKYFRVIGFMDLAFGKSSRADYTALVIVGYFQHTYYFLESMIKRGATENDMVKMIREAHRLFPQLLNVIYIEEDLQQISVVERLKKKCPFISIQGFSSRQEMQKLKREDSGQRADLNGKQLRIWSQLEGIIEDRKLVVNKNMRFLKEFKDEFISFPDCRHFDVIDALGNAVSKLKEKSVLIKIIGMGSRLGL